MNVLVLNAGSSSVKCQLYAMEGDVRVLARCRVERIGSDTALFVVETPQEERTHVLEVLDHTSAVRHVLHALAGVLQDGARIDAVGHRVVHGGELFSESVRITDAVIAQIKKLYDLAPLHNPAHVSGIRAIEANLPDVPQVAVFDTAFHHTLPEHAYRYAIPSVLYYRHKVRKYGFHGISHMYVSRRIAALLGRAEERVRIVSCHLGNGASVAAIAGGRSIDTSMGMTPLEGLMMGTRSGDIDAAIVPFVMAKEELSASEVQSMLNKHSGLLAVSGVSGDMREIVARRDSGDAAAVLAFEMFVYRLRKYIGAYAVAMDGVDAIVFTAGIGEHAHAVRAAVCARMTVLGVQLDEHANTQTTPLERCISTPQSRVAVWVVPTNEERVIADETYALVREGC